MGSRRRIRLGPRSLVLAIGLLPACADVIDYLRDMGLRDRFQVIIGGAETSQEQADGMGADGWAPDAVAAVRLCRGLVGEEAREQP